jgi:DMSO/TMAO reductase YedYZ molybdopterin-dependent catalytic subunit
LIVAPAFRFRAGRRTNLALLALLAAAAVTGALSFAIGGSWVRWAVVAHGVAGLGIVALAPWKSAISARGVRRHPPKITLSFALAATVVATVVTGVGHATGVLGSLGPVSAMQLHVAAAVASMPLAVWHVLARKTVPHRTDVSRRNLLRGGVLLGGAAAGYVAVEGFVHVAGLPGHARRSTGSYERGSFQPVAMPVTQWLNDTVPDVDLEGWTLRIADAEGERDVAYEELLAHRDTVQAVLDCTGGWYADQEWEGVVLADLLAGDDRAASIEVFSLTGYIRRLPAEDAGRLLLATRVGGRALSAGHGFPLRLVAPGRRGFWWVKWVDRVSLSETPWWWQAPFPPA